MIPIVIASFILCLGDPIPVASTNTNGQNQPRSLPGRRVMGDVIGIDQHPAMASIQDDGRHVCAGSIISKSTILTTYQCTRDTVTGLSVRVGTSTANKGGSIHDVIAIRHHEGNEVFGETVVNGVALMKVSPQFRMGPSVVPLVSLINLANENDVVTPFAILKVAGWKTLHFNDTMMLRSATLRVTECPRNSSNSGVILEQHICAVPHDKGIAEICQGSLGGPIIGSDHLVGFISTSGKRCISRRNPIVFTGVAAFRDWIDTNVQIMENIKEGTDLDTFFEENVRPSILPFWTWKKSESTI